MKEKQQILWEKLKKHKINTTFPFTLGLILEAMEEYAVQYHGEQKEIEKEVLTK